MGFNLILLLAGTIMAFWLSAICGGGASLILIPILNLMLPTSVVPFSLTVGTFTSSASRIAVFKKYINWKIFLWFVPFSIPAVLLGAWLLKYVNPLYLQIIVGFFLVANLPQLFLKKKEIENEEKPYPKYVLAIVGFFAGFVSGITGAIGLLFNKFYLRYGLSKEEIVATRAANEIFLHLIKLIIYCILGLYSKEAIGLGVAIGVGAIISSYTVKFILPHISELLFRRIGYGAMVVSGITLLVSTSQKIVAQDKISISTISKQDQTEASINWRHSNFVLEFAFDDGLEVERPIAQEELPDALQLKYDELSKEYSKIHLEKVYKIGEKSYEFYCYKNGNLTKFEYDEDFK